MKIPYNSLINVVESIKKWLRGSWIISSCILLLLILCFALWAKSSISTKASLKLTSIHQLFSASSKLLETPYDIETLGFTRFNLSKEGVIKRSSPQWLEGVSLAGTPFFDELKQLSSQDKNQTLPSNTRQGYFLKFYPDLVNKVLSPHLVFITEQHINIISMQHFSHLFSEEEAPDILLTNDNGQIIFSPYLHRLGESVSNTGIALNNGRLLYANAEQLNSLNPVSIIAYEDISGISFIISLIIILFLSSLYYLNTRIRAVFHQLFLLRDEFDQIAAVTKSAGDNRNSLLKHTHQIEPTSLAGLRKSVNQLQNLEINYQENIRIVSLLEWLILTNVKLSESITEKEEQFTLLTGLSPVGVFHADSHGTIKYVNARLCDILGVDGQALVGNRWEAFIHPEDRKAYLSDRETHHGMLKKQIRCLRPDGMERYLISEEMFQLDSLKKFSGIIGAVTDITDVKHTEAALKESEARWQFALDGSGNGVWDWNLETNEAYFSPQWASILGYQEDEISDQIDEWSSRVHPDDLDDAENAVKQHLDGITAHYQSEHRLLCKDGHYKWVLDRGKVIDWCDDGRPLRMIGTHSDITERKSNEAKIHHLAYHDSLTGLPNRAYLQEELFFLLSQLKRSNQNTALLFLDIDHFKMVNDSMGHLVGDQMLQQVASRLKSSVRDEDFLVRLGGDEFVILLGNPSEDVASVYRRAKKVSDNVLNAFKEPFEFSGQKIISGTSIGVVVFPEDGKSVKEILQHADTAMYQAKKDGRNTLHYYRQELATAIKRRIYIENGLRTAIEENELALFYQPKVSLSTDNVVGAEALIRWNHKGENISPAEFIPIAEESGLILTLGPWVLEQACKQMTYWKTQENFESLCYMAINVSPHQFTQPSFVEDVRSIVRSSKVNPCWLELELTEGVFMQNVDKSKDKMFELKEMGIRFAVDDFGTGYSSLAYLKQLPVDILKVDQAFVRDLAIDPNDASIVKTVLAMAHALGMEAVAEGVESEKHIEFLKREGCKYFQGYYFSKPLSVKDFEALMLN